MKKIAALIIVVALLQLDSSGRLDNLFGSVEQMIGQSAGSDYSAATAESTAASTTAASSDTIIGRAFAQQQSNVQVQGRGRVTRILADDNDGGAHQRFIISLDSGQTLLIAHNIELAPRVAGINEGDTVEFYGEYAWNDQGGVIHWTHHDPHRRHVAGWLRHSGMIYQ